MPTVMSVLMKVGQENVRQNTAMSEPKVTVTSCLKAIIPILPQKTKEKLFFVRRDQPESLNFGRVL